jgi:hypothetical protein
MVLILAEEILLADKRSVDDMKFRPLLAGKRPFLYTKCLKIIRR